ncbi:UvrD-helicase domain-containing protein [Rheinheimera oceanensis]|uniref:UvrD-helicase domain-containing protein n=1 Tax=Rheinheimera oceanensis TaxID=2817449 RepID=UPI001BFED267|nr:UvrD-helicase domain-containing protein [Rheinheimera oceanensis]
MNWLFHFKKIIKKLNLTSRAKRKNTADQFKVHYRKLGYALGYTKAKDELTSVIEHAYAKEPEYSEIHQDHVVPASLISFQREDIISFHRQVFGDKPKDRQPNEDQIKLIFSQSRNTLAIAGAGSGKTTSLINRLLFLHLKCKVPLEQLTVFSFTRASVSDFREKLIEVFSANGIEVTKDKSEQIIRTFHSKVLEMSKNSFMKGKFRIFEFLKDKIDKDLESKDDEAQYKAALKKANEELVVVSELNNAQSDLLFEALERCYCEDSTFRRKINSLILEKLKLKMGENDPSLDPNIIKKTNAFEQQLVPFMSGFFNLNENAKPGKQLDLSRSDFNKLILTSDAYYPAHNIHIIYAPNKTLLKNKNLDRQLDVDGFKQGIGALAKRKAFIGVNYASDRVFVVTEQQDVSALESLLSNASTNREADQEYMACPRFSAKFDGDYTFKPITDVFFEIATFSESVGVKPEHLAPHTGKTQMSKTDKLLLEAVGPFWKMLDKVLAEENIIRFNNMFQTFSTPHNRAFKALSPKVKYSLTNIIIDEFQDISPEVAKWVQATLRTLTQEGIKTSLMCVGDDFQSIYGWRGSSPEFLSDYENRFPSENIFKVFMSQNYRSYQSIVDTAESCLKYQRDFEKAGKCQLNDNRPRLSFQQSPASKNKGINTTIIPASELLVDIQKKLLDENKPGRDTDLLVMAKTNNVLDSLKKMYEKNLKVQTKTESGVEIKVQFQTFHRSKGLEARYCLLVEDCEYDNQHHAKNYLYKLAGFSKTFDESQSEEAMRLAYVAITRAKEKVWWITSEGVDGSFVVAKSYAEKHGHALKKETLLLLA